MNYNSYSKFKRKKNLHFLIHKPLSSIPENKEHVVLLVEKTLLQ